MKTIKSTSGKKAVRITNNNGTFNASYLQYFGEDEQVLEMKSYKSEAAAIRYANKKLN